ncbi:MAG: RNA polymerase sigma factor [Verrucomicrobiales bacterium]
MNGPRFNIDDAARPAGAGPSPSGAVERSEALVDAVRRMARRDATGLDDVFHLCGDALFSFALRALHSRGDAEEVVQDTLVRLWHKAPTYDPARSHPFTWAMLITRGLVADRLRARHRRVTLVGWEGMDEGSREEGPWPAAGAAPWTCGRREDWEAAWAGLSEIEQRTLQRAVFTPATAEDIARELGEPLGTVKARVRRALAKLRRVLFWEDPSP